MSKQLINLLKSTHLPILEDLSLIKQAKPIIHNITNIVVMQTCANVLLSVGASPIMAHAEEELVDLASFTKALVINIGTLDETWVKAIFCAQKLAQKKHTPLIFDPVGAGCTSYRTLIAKKILEGGVSVLRGNASEIMSLQNSKIITAGIDSAHSSDYAKEAARELAIKYNCVVAVSGVSDYIVSPHNECVINQGTPLFTAVTGMGCSVTALIGAFTAINSDYFLAAQYAMTLFAVSGEVAAQSVKGCGSFYIELLDNLYMCANT